MSAPIVSRARMVLVFLFTLSLVLAHPAAPAGAAAIDSEAELRVAKTAYDALRRNLYTEPDTVVLLMSAQREAQKALGQAVPLDNLDGSADQQWGIFAQNIRTMVAQSGDTKLAPGDLAHKLADGMARSVNDLHTYFLDPKAADSVRRKDNGDTSIVNFGFTSINVNNGIYVRSVVPSSPVDEAGLRSGDHAIAIDGSALNPTTRTTLLGSPQEGHDYVLTVQHVGDANPVDLAVHIHKYVRTALVSRVLDGHIGYIQTFAFYDSIPKELDAALADLHKQKVDSLIVDFRGNPGGVSVDRVMGRFLPSGTELGVSKGRRVQRKSVTIADGHARETLPVVVLVDDGSGSASEIAALAFREFDRGTLVGTKTAGAVGSTQRTELGDGSLLSITVAVYISAKGASLNAIGITPDIVVDRTNDDVLAGRDPQLDAAIGRANALIDPISARPSPLAA